MTTRPLVEARRRWTPVPLRSAGAYYAGKSVSNRLPHLARSFSRSALRVHADHLVRPHRGRGTRGHHGRDHGSWRDARRRGWWRPRGWQPG
jgi:hypothetical protein